MKIHNTRHLTFHLSMLSSLILCSCGTHDLDGGNEIIDFEGFIDYGSPIKVDSTAGTGNSIEIKITD